MTLEELQNEVGELRRLVDAIHRPGSYVFSKPVRFDAGAKIIGAIYPGIVDGDGTALSLPQFWTSATTGTGKYTVTHNLGTTSYVVVLTAVQSGLALKVPNLATVTASAFTVEIDDTINYSNSRFHFILMRT